MRDGVGCRVVLLGDDRVASDAVVSALGEADGVAGFGLDVPATLAWAQGRGRERSARSLTDSWELLASTAARDVGAARILEPHLDALSILDEAEAQGIAVDTGDIAATDDATWGVFAAEGAGVRLTAARRDGRWTLDGTKPWCSLAAHLSHALVTAWIDDERRALFAVDLRAAGVSVHPGPWHARGLAQVVSAPVDFAAVPAVAVGDAGWYLARSGFARGGIGVAACWWGGAVPLRDALHRAASRDGADQLARVHLGRADTALWGARAALAEAARLVEARAVASEKLLADRVRAIVSDAAELTLAEADRALGPRPLVADEEHARRAADLHLYLRQHHAERDLARLGARLAEGSAAW
jgi:alkylation response protein AidB-like acyl-CoA dehydrogenase